MSSAQPQVGTEAMQIGVIGFVAHETLFTDEQMAH